MEEWRKVPFEELQHYEISTLGNVRVIPESFHSKRNGKDFYIIYERNRPVLILYTLDGHRKKFSLPLLMLKTFKHDLCPGDEKVYTAAYIDGDCHNNSIDNLKWISRAALVVSVAKEYKGQARNKVKYKNILVKLNGQIVGYFFNENEGAKLFNSYGIETSASAIHRAIENNKQFYFIFDLEPVSDNEYKVVSDIYKQVNLKVLYDIIVEDRKHSRKLNTKVKRVVKKQIVYKEKIVYKPKIEKQIVYKDKIVYRDKVKVVYKDKDEKPKKNKVLASAKQKTDKLIDIDDKEFYKEQEQLKKDKFKEELLKRLHIS